MASESVRESVSMVGVLYSAVVAVVGLVVAGSIASLLILLIAAALARRERPGDQGVPAAPPRMVVVVPAHNEELVLAATLSSLAAQDYPKGRYEVVVVADNCTDATADLARTQGATVLERADTVRRGKGYALDWVFSQLLRRPSPADAFVVIDADTWVAPDFLCRMAARLAAQTDARGMCALQGRYGVLNAEEGWRAALMAGAFDLFNHVKPLGRDRLGLSVGLKGNGMAFSRAVLEQARWSGDSITEDIDFGLHLARDYGVRVGYVSEARVLAQMPTTAAQAASQRQRWEGGRYALLRRRALPLLAAGLRGRNLLLCDAAWDLMLPPLAELAALLLLWGLLIVGGGTAHLLRHVGLWSAAAALCLLGLAVYVVGGFRVAGAPRAAYLALTRAPFYAAWKFCLYGMRLARRGRGPSEAEWVRTDRKPLPAAPPPGVPPVTESSAE